MEMEVGWACGKEVGWALDEGSTGVDAGWRVSQRGHPKRRWLDSLIGYFKTRLDEASVHWTVCAADREAWTELEDDFVLSEWIL